MKKKATLKIESFKVLNEINFEVKIETTSGLKTYVLPYYLVDEEKMEVKGFLSYNGNTFKKVILQGRNQEYEVSVFI